MLSPGALLAGRYRLLRELGRGGMGVVWHARNEAIDRQVALKIMVPALAASEEALRRFFNEARICGGIRHPGIVDVLDLGRAEDGTPFLVMELLDGLSLETVLEQRPSLPPAMACRLVRDVATTVALAHDRGIVHRDLKPGNIFIQRPTFGPLVVKVLDFGISKMLGGGQGATTSAGVLVGTPAYMSPEQASGLPDLDHRVDVYALGVILYELLSGSLPHQGATAQAMVLDVATRPATPITVHAPDLSPMLVEVVEAALARDLEQRVPDARTLASHLDRVMTALGLDPDALDELAPPVSPTMQPLASSGSVDTTPRGGVPIASETEPSTAPKPPRRPTTDPTMRSGEDPVPARPAAVVATVSPVTSSVGHGATRTWVGAAAAGALAAVALVWWFVGRRPQASESAPASTASTAPSSVPAAEATVERVSPAPSATAPAEATAAPAAASASAAAGSAAVRPGAVGPRPSSKRPAASAAAGAATSAPGPDKGIWEYE